MASFRYKHGDRPLEGYTIQRGAGRGGFGEVYYAVSDSGREVALKVVQDYAQIELRGISQCMNLKSPHLVTVFDVRHNDEGVPFVIMEYVSGPTLRQLLDEAPGGLGTQKAAFFLREIGKGLSYLHDCGIVHRDLKPGNIFYENGYVKIGDYGLSKAITTSQHSEQTVTVGTVHYMAPEIGLGKYDRGIDIYALGAMLYELLTGQVPYIGASPAEILMKHVTGQPDLTGIEEPFATAIRKAMCKDPAERYQSVQEMVEAVFGAEHIQQSVSQFSPEDLTMVAQRAAARMAQRVAVGVGGGSSATPPPLPHDRGNRSWGDELGELGGRVGQRMGDIGERVGQRMAELGSRFGQRMAGLGARRNSDVAGTAPMAPPPVLDTVLDPLTRRQRRVIMGTTALLVAGATAIFTEIQGYHGSPPPMPVFLIALYSIVACAVAVRFAHFRVLPQLRGDSPAVRRLMMGCVTAAPLVIPAFITSTSGRSPAQMAVSRGCLAIMLLMFLMNWQAMSEPVRRERIALRPVLLAGLFGFLASLILEGSLELGIGVMAGMALAVQVISPWDPNGWRAAQARRGGPTQAIPAAEVAGGAAVNIPQAAAAGPMPDGAAVRLIAPPALPVPVLRNGRYIPPAVRWIWLGAAVVLLTSGVLLLASLGIMRYRTEETVPVIGFGIGMLVLALMSLRKSVQTRFYGWWPYLVRPLLLWCCAESVLMASVSMGNMRMSDDEQMIALFFIIFPSVLLLAILLVRFRGERPPELPGAAVFPANAPTMMMPPNAVAAEGGAGMAAAGAAGIAGAAAAAEGGLIAARPPGASRWSPPTAAQPISVMGVLLGIGGAALMLLSMLGAVVVAMRMPTMIASGAVDPSLAEQMRRDFGYADWPRLAQTICQVAAHVGLLVAAALLMFARRSAGGWHLLRVPAAAFALIFSYIMLDDAFGTCVWKAVYSDSGQLVPVAAVDQFLSHAQTAPAVIAACLAVLAIVLLAWPAGRQHGKEMGR